MEWIHRDRQISKVLFSAFIMNMFILWTPASWAEVKPSLAILPFFTERVKDPAKGAACPICKGVYRRGAVLSNASQGLTRLLYKKMETAGAFRVIPLESVEGALSQWDKAPFEEKLILSSIQLGNDLNADFLFLGFVFRFEERVGSSLGVERPASTGFDLHLLRLKDGKTVWEGKFDETQRPLSENLLEIGSFFRRKAHWLTAEELADDGMEEMLKKLPGVKELLESP